MQKQRVIVLMGGPSAEYEVSLNTGREILKNLDTKKYIAEPIVVSKTGAWLSSKESKKLLAGASAPSKPTQTSTALAPRIPTQKGDVVFIAMHGEFGEDGTIQGVLDAMGVPYTGSGMLASALGMDKPRSRSVFRDCGLTTPTHTLIPKKEWTNEPKKIYTRIKRHHPLPWVIKPTNRGSSVGVSIVKNKKEALSGMQDAFSYSHTIMVEQFINGREMTCGVLEDKDGDLTPLPPTEILPKAGAFYDYTSKYGEAGSEHDCPPKNISAKKTKEIQDAACRAHTAIGARGMSRADFILARDGTLYILEINTIPGMTQTSLLPEAAANMGISFPKLLDVIIRSAQ